MEKVAASSPAWNSTLRTPPAWRRDWKADIADNALPQLATANVNCRVCTPEDSFEYVLSTLQKVVGDDQVSIKPKEDFVKGPSSPLRPDLLNAVTRITDTMWPGVATIPMMVMGGTDGPLPPQRRNPYIYGIQGFFMDRDDIRFHGRDERLLVQSFYEGQKFL